MSTAPTTTNIWLATCTPPTPLTGCFSCSLWLHSVNETGFRRYYEVAIQANKRLYGWAFEEKSLLGKIEAGLGKVVEREAGKVPAQI